LLRARWRTDGLFVCQPQLDPSSSRVSDAGCPPETESKIYHAWRDTTELYSEDVWLLPVCWREKADELVGLVVALAGGSTEYRRVGCFQDSSPRWMSKDDIIKLDREDITFI